MGNFGDPITRSFYRQGWEDCCVRCRETHGLNFFCSSVDPIESLAEVMNYFQRDVLFGKDL